jgi:hypothetical protein
MSAPERERTACIGSGGSWSQLVGTTAIVLPLEVGDAVYGYPAPARKALDRRPLGQRAKGRRQKRRSGRCEPDAREWKDPVGTR